ncbi:MAG: hypothetical protein ACLPOO_11325 [Terriglobales bacterium]
MASAVATNVHEGLATPDRPDLKPNADRRRELERAVPDRTDELSTSGPDGLLEKYREMASDSRHEAEAEEWSEGIIGDASAGTPKLKTHTLP